MALFPLLLIAAAFWGQTPECGSPTVERVQLQPPVVGLADPSTCSILIDARAASKGAGWECMVVLHEYGHVLGLGHSQDPSDIMYPTLRKVTWPCAW